MKRDMWVPLTSAGSPTYMSTVATVAGMTRHLVLIFGDQINLDNPALNGFDPECDRVLMIEAASEATRVWSHKARIVLFLSALRHFCAALVVC